MADNIVKLILEGDSRRLNDAINRSGKQIKGFGRKAVGTFNRIGKTIGHISDRYLTRFNTILGGAGIALAGKAVIDFDSKLARLSIQAGLTKKEMFQLKDQLFQVADATHQAPTDLLEGVNAIVERTGNFKFAIASLKDMGIVASATGSAMADIGATASNMMDKAKLSSNEVIEVFDILAAQGKKGAFTLQSMARMMERLLAASGRVGVEGVNGMRVFGAWLQVAKKGTGSAEQATTAIEGAIAEMLDPEKAKKIRQRTGFNVIDVDASRKEGRTVMKSLDVMLKGIIKGAKGDEAILGQIFGRESIRAITRMAQVFRQTGRFGEFDQFIKLGGDGAAIMKDFAFWEAQTAAKLGDFRTQLSKFANENLAGPIDLLNKALDTLNKHPALTKGALYTLIGAAGILGGAKIIGGIRNVFRGGGKGAGGIGGGMFGGAGPMPVYVVNRHLSMLPGKGWGFPGGGKIGGILKKMPGGGAIARFFPKLAPFLTKGALGKIGLAGAGGYAVGSLLNRGMGWASGKLTGGRHSGKGWIGSMIHAGVYGDEGEKNRKTEALFGDLYAARKAGDRELEKKILNDIKLIVNIDKNGRVRTETDSMNTIADVKRGNFEVGD